MTMTKAASWILWRRSRSWLMSLSSTITTSCTGRLQTRFCISSARRKKTQTVLCTNASASNNSSSYLTSLSLQSLRISRPCRQLLKVTLLRLIMSFVFCKVYHVYGFLYLVQNFVRRYLIVRTELRKGVFLFLCPVLQNSFFISSY